MAGESKTRIRQTGKKKGVPFNETALGKRIPGEIRNAIWRYALKVPEGSHSVTNFIYRTNLTTDTNKNTAFFLNEYVEDWFPFLSKRPEGYYSKDKPSIRVLGKSGRFEWVDPPKPPTRPEEFLGLLRTCRQIYKEALHIFYEVNRIRFKSDKTLVEVCNKFPDRFLHLRSIKILGLKYGSPVHLMRTVARCTNLSEFEIFVPVARKHMILNCAAPRVQRILRGMRGFKRVDIQCYNIDSKHSWDMNFIGVPEECVKVVDGMKALMLRPKLTTNEASSVATVASTSATKDIAAVDQKEGADTEHSGRKRKASEISDDNHDGGQNADTGGQLVGNEVHVTDGI
ncbi:MAG: hypothetical protein LQ338_003693 [Usnochroma carphineum]|nr:MAG: hypothetical protein LQ338_003693 [Usnochroma carphineum]